jgi:toxin ParE1/3/4
MKYDFHPAAETEFLESVGYYESRVPGLGGALIEELETLADLICDAPKAWQVALVSDRIYSNFNWLSPSWPSAPGSASVSN